MPVDFLAFAVAVGVPVVPVLLLLLVSFGSCSAYYTTPYNVYVTALLCSALGFDVATLVNIIRIIEQYLSTNSGR